MFGRLLPILAKSGNFNGVFCIFKGVGLPIIGLPVRIFIFGECRLIIGRTFVFIGFHIFIFGYWLGLFIFIFGLCWILLIFNLTGWRLGICVCVANLI